MAQPQNLFEQNNVCVNAKVALEVEVRLWEPDGVFGAVRLRQGVIGPAEDEGVGGDLADDDVAQLRVAVELADLVDELEEEKKSSFSKAAK